MTRLTAAAAAILVLGGAGAATAQTSQNCGAITDPAARLVCYDRQNAARPVAPGPAAREIAPEPAGVGKDHVPVPPEDRAFDPRAQRLAPEHIGLVTPPLRRIGAVPVRSWPGSNVPVVTLAVPLLMPVPGERWTLSLELANNSPRDLDVRIACMFRNGERVVADAMVLLRGVLAGERVSAVVHGPPVTDFVDNAPCHVLSPLE